MTEKKDETLFLNLVQEGNELAFKHLFETYFTPLCRFMHLYIKETTIVEELALDIFMYVWENRKTLQIQLSLKAYMFQAAKNKCLNVLRQKKITMSLEDMHSDMAETDEMSLETEELYHLIQEAVLALPNKCKEVFNLSRAENRSNHEIATQLDISEKTVEGHITNALKRIKTFLGESYSYLW
ncbi:MAG: RNA polymerase sigma-70 factor [Paludibacter sp.]